MHDCSKPPPPSPPLPPPPPPPPPPHTHTHLFIPPFPLPPLPSPPLPSCYTSSTKKGDEKIQPVFLGGGGGGGGGGDSPLRPKIMSCSLTFQDITRPLLKMQANEAVAITSCCHAQYHNHCKLLNIMVTFYCDMYPGLGENSAWKQVVCLKNKNQCIHSHAHSQTYFTCLPNHFFYPNYTPKHDSSLFCQSISLFCQSISLFCQSISLFCQSISLCIPSV